MRVLTFSLKIVKLKTGLWDHVGTIAAQSSQLVNVLVFGQISLNRVHAIFQVQDGVNNATATIRRPTLFCGSLLRTAPAIKASI